MTGEISVTLYKIILVIHILSAIIGIGPGYVLTYIAMHAKTMTELRHAYYLRNRVHIFVMIGGTLILVTGILMGFMRPELFRKGWYMLSMVLYLIALAIEPLLLIKKKKNNKDVIELNLTEKIKEIYYH